jgi:hypothetical protein
MAETNANNQDITSVAVMKSGISMLPKDERVFFTKINCMVTELGSLREMLQDICLIKTTDLNSEKVKNLRILFILKLLSEHLNKAWHSVCSHLSQPKARHKYIRLLSKPGRECWKDLGKYFASPSNKIKELTNRGVFSRNKRNDIFANIDNTVNGENSIHIFYNSVDQESRTLLCSDVFEHKLYGSYEESICNEALNEMVCEIGGTVCNWFLVFCGECINIMLNRLKRRNMVVWEN